MRDSRTARSGESACSSAATAAGVGGDSDRRPATATAAATAAVGGDRDRRPSTGDSDSRDRWSTEPARSRAGSGGERVDSSEEDHESGDPARCARAGAGGAGVRGAGRRMGMRDCALATSSSISVRMSPPPRPPGGTSKGSIRAGTT